MSVTIEEPAAAPYAQPTLVQQPDDAAVGAALRHVMAALPSGWFFDLLVNGTRCIASAANTMVLGEPLLTGRGSTPAAALDDLWAALDARAHGGHLHDWRTVDFGQVCITRGCGVQR